MAETKQATLAEGAEVMDIVKEVQSREATKDTWIAFEYFPPRTEAGVENLVARWGRMKKHKPLYMDVTWGAGGSTSELTMDLCVTLQKQFNLPANMHITCTNMPREKLDTAVAQCKQHGVRNIVALRGDPPAGQVDWKPIESGFACALDLVKYLREREGDYFHITVAGYPEGHPQRIKKVEEGRVLSERELRRVSTDDKGDRFVCSDEDFEAELAYLKQKQDAGAGMVVTQMFFDTQVYFDFVAACRAYGITIPIVPGVMCVTAYAGFKRMIAFCCTRVPDKVSKILESIKDDADKVKAFGIELGATMCQELLDGGVRGLHFYTLNLEAVVDGILEALHLGKFYDDGSFE